MRPTTLEAWLDYQQQLHPQAIALGLERVREVWSRLGAPLPAPVVITVGGTNGKGSTVAFLEAMLAAGGMKVGAYTSPHLLRYNERVRVAGVDVTDAVLVDAFARIEGARSEVPLTYFEFGTLAAFLVFADAAVDVAVLEVGLGGRLDAVNLVDADAAIVATVDLDHQAWLGPDRESIGREKAGIFRAGRPAISGESDPPASLVAHARAIGARLEVLGRDFGWDVEPGLLRFWRKSGAGDSAVSAERTVSVIPETLVLEGAFQRANAAAAIAALSALGDRVRWRSDVLAVRVQRAGTPPFLAARLQRIDTNPELVVDVGHNPQAARALADWLATNPAAGRTRAVYGALSDKDVSAIAAALSGHVDEWFLAGLDGESPRGMPVAELRERVRRGLPTDSVARMFTSPGAALDAAFAASGPDDRILAFGSFFIAAVALRAAATRNIGV
ncbi:MAG: bifunctional tetrahydrofolate synthase/dihydrofolate synthase [Lysobacterales bacterium]